MADPETPGAPRSTDREAIAAEIERRREYAENQWKAAGSPDIDTAEGSQYLGAMFVLSRLGKDLSDGSILASLPQTGVEAAAGRDVEAAAWAWLEKKFGTENDDPVDRAYAADEMVDAFHAGRSALTPKVIDRDIEGETIERCAKVAEEINGFVSATSIAAAIRALPSLHGDGK